MFSNRESGCENGTPTLQVEVQLKSARLLTIKFVVDSQSSLLLLRRERRKSTASYPDPAVAVRSMLAAVDEFLFFLRIASLVLKR